MVELGVLYGTRVGVAKDPAEARKLFERAAKDGNPRGIFQSLGAQRRRLVESREARPCLRESRGGQFGGRRVSARLDGPPTAPAVRVTMSPRAPCSKKATAQGHAEAMVCAAPLPNWGAADRRIQASPNPISRKPPRSATRRPRPASSRSNVPMC